MPIRHDSDTKKGATESESPTGPSTRSDSHSNLADQLPHRSPDPMIKDQDHEHDTDFPEPGRTPEHSGQHE